MHAGLGVLGGIIIVAVAVSSDERLDFGLVTVSVVIFVAQLVGGIGFALGRNRLALPLWPLSVLYLVAFPIGTLIGGYSLWVLYRTKEQSGTTGRVLAITAVATLAIIMLLGVVGSLLQTANRSPLERDLLDAVAAQGGEEEFQRWLGTLPRSGGAVLVAVERVGKPGLLRLPIEDQATRLQLLLEVMRRTSIAACAAMARGTASAQQRRALIEGLDSSDLRRWSAIQARAILSELRGSPPLIEASGTDVSDFGSFVSQSVSDADRRRVYLVHDSLASASDADVCWYAQLWYGRALQADASRARWIRVLTTLAARYGQ